MKITILSIGKTRSSQYVDLENEYIGRIHGRFSCEKQYVKNEKDLLQALSVVKGAIIMMDENGSVMNSREFADFLDHTSQNVPAITFVIGDAEGLSAESREYSTDIIALSEMTFPHELARVILIEQLYRAQTIIEGHPYHKD